MRGKKEQRELDRGTKTLEKKGRITLHVRSNADPRRAGADEKRAVN